MKKRIAVTGGIGSGKSTVCNLLENMGYSVFSCDEIYRNIIHSKRYVQEIENVFPSVVKQGEIDKKLLSEIIFLNKKKRVRLNQIAHPMIMKTLIKQMSASKEEIVFAEVPLLFEGGFEKEFDQTIVVVRDLDDRIQAVCNRDGISPKEAIARIQSQFDYDSPKNKVYLKKINALVLENKGDVSSLETTLKQLLKQLS